jgi:hypothetical protein
MQRQSLRSFEDHIAEQMDHRIRQAQDRKDDLMYEEEKRIFRLNIERMKFVQDQITQ